MILCTNQNRSIYADCVLKADFFHEYSVLVCSDDGDQSHGLRLSILTRTFSTLLRKLSSERNLKQVSLSYEDSDTTLEESFVVTGRYEMDVTKRFLLGIVDQQIELNKSLYKWRANDIVVEFSVKTL